MAGCQSSAKGLENTVASAWSGYSGRGVYREIKAQRGVETVQRPGDSVV